MDFLGELGKLGILRKFANLRKGKSAPSSRDGSQESNKGDGREDSRRQTRAEGLLGEREIVGLEEEKAKQIV